MSLKDKFFNIKEDHSGYTSKRTITILGLKFKCKIKNANKSEFCPQLLDDKILTKIEDANPDKKNYFAITSILKNEAMDIKEWIEFHRLAGVEHFYLYDNESNDNVYEILKPYIKEGIVTYHYVQGKLLQYPVYRDAIFRYQDKASWMALIDLDEFLYPVEKNDIKEALKDFEKYPALSVNSIFFDCNGIEKRPKNSLVIETFTRMSTQNLTGGDVLVKTIVNPKEVLHVIHPHNQIYKNNQLSVNENFKKLDRKKFWCTNGASLKKIRLNHYYTKSVEEYMQKIQKEYADQTSKRPFFEERLHLKNNRQDYTALKYLAELKEKLASEKEAKGV